MTGYNAIYIMLRLSHEQISTHGYKRNKIKN